MASTALCVFVSGLEWVARHLQTAALQPHVEWLMGLPGGFKINQAVSRSLGSTVRSLRRQTLRSPVSSPTRRVPR